VTSSLATLRSSFYDGCPNGLNTCARCYGRLRGFCRGEVSWRWLLMLAMK